MAKKVRANALSRLLQVFFRVRRSLLPSASQIRQSMAKLLPAKQIRLNLLNDMVPKKGLEPPHPCEYMDLNHARLPIPPLRHDKSSAIGWIGSNP